MVIILSNLKRFKITGKLLGKFTLKSVNIWQSYKQERRCLVHCLRLLAV